MATATVQRTARPALNAPPRHPSSPCAVLHHDGWLAGWLAGVLLQYALYFLIIAVASGIAAFLEVALPMVAAERQVRRLREDYLRALLRQDMEWFDTNRAGEVASRMAEDSILVMGGIAEQLPNTIHYLIT